MMGEGVSEKKLWLSRRSQEQLEEIERRKQSLSLDLKRVLPASLDSLNGCDEPSSTCDSTSFEEANNRKFATALSLFPQGIPSSDTAETFHTAAADSPEPRLVFENADTLQMNNSARNGPENSEEPDNKVSSQMTRNIGEVTNNEEMKQPTVVSTIPESMLQDSLESPIQQNPVMRRLNQRIARQRMMVMRCLDAGTPSKEDLNRQIMILQDLQKQQIELEVSLLEDERKSHMINRQLQCGGVDGGDDDDNDRLVISETEDYVQKEPNAYCSVVEPTNNSSAILLTVAQPRSQLFRNNRPNVNDQETLSESLAPKRASSRGYSTVYLTVSCSLTISLSRMITAMISMRIRFLF